MTNLYIFDKDGTICRSKSGGKFINSVEDQELIPGVKEVCDQLRAEGHILAVASNQGGVAWGFMAYEEAGQIVYHAASLIGAQYAVFCPHHREGTVVKYVKRCYCRKPEPGMLKEIIDWAFYAGKNVERVIFVGDMVSDKETAEASNFSGRPLVEFVWAKDFFKQAE